MSKAGLQTGGGGASQFLIQTAATAHQVCGIVAAAGAAACAAKC